MLNKLKTALLKARKEKDTLRVSVLGYLLAEIQNKEIDLRRTGAELIDEHVEEALNKQIKQRKESIEQYKEGKREDLVEKEASELEVLEELSREYFG